MQIEQIEELATLHCKLANAYADAADAEPDDGEAYGYEMASAYHAELAIGWQMRAERWHHLAAKMSAENTDYWTANHDEKGNWTGPVRNENGWTP